MKQLTFVGILLASGFVAQSQIDVTINDELDKTLKAEAISLVSYFMRSLKHTNYCPFPNMNGILDQFHTSATIEVSGLTKETKSFTPAQYFENLKEKRCGNDAAYNQMKFAYMPIDKNMVSVKHSEGRERKHVMVVFNQRFDAKGANGKKYCDITIKHVTIDFWYESNNVLIGKIMKIEVAETGPCHGEDKKYTASR